MRKLSTANPCRRTLSRTLRTLATCIGLCSLSLLPAAAQQVPNASFEDWSGTAFDGNIQPANWNASNVTQFGFKFNFAHKEAGHTGAACMMVQDQEVGAAGITEVSPGYFSLGQPWVYVKSLTAVSQATAGTDGGVAFTYRPDTMSVWIRRTGANVSKEDFYLLYYAWSGTAKGTKYKGKNGSCTDLAKTNEESDIRQALDGNECGTDQKANQIAEGLWYEKKEYAGWTNIRVPIYYFSSDAPTMMNIIFSASNYPNFRATSGLYAGNSLYVDDVELIYSAAIQKLFIDDKEWKGFNPNTSEEQTYSLGRSATALPKIEARRGAGSLTNAHGTTATFAGRVLSGKEITIQDGVIDGAPTVITVKSEDGSRQQVYKIRFVREASKNAKLADIRVNGTSVPNFNANTFAYTVDLPYGTTEIPVVSADGQEDAQTIEITQPASTTGKATIKVTAADKQTTLTYTLTFRVAELADNTLQDILVNGKSLAGFTPTQTIYRVSLPVGTTVMPTIQAVSAYPAGAQTIKYTAPDHIDGGTYQIAVTTPGNLVPKTYKLNFRLEASSYSYLRDLQVEGGYITEFAPDNFTYYVTLPMGTAALPQITYVLGDEYQQVSISEGGLDGTTRITVTAANGDQSVYKIVFNTLKSEISSLAGIRIGGVDLPDFSADKTEYTYTLPIGTTEMPQIEALKGDEYETVSIISGGLNGTTRIVVAAGNGNTTVYLITLSVLQATDASLQMIYIDGVELPDFDKNRLEYTVNLPQGTTRQPEVTYTPNDPYQTITVRSGSGVTDDYKITVRPQSGAGQTYVIHFTVATSANTALQMIYVGGEALSNFHSDTLDYTYTLPAGVTTVPSVTFDKSEAAQKVLSMCENTTWTLAVTAENGDKRTYTIRFIIQKSENAFLRMIYLDGQPLAGFDKNTLTYTQPLASSSCPRITVDKEEGQQVTITAPHAAGVAYIRVTPESGAANVYAITFTAALSSNATLENIYLAGKPLSDFEPQTTDYTVSYADTLPAVTYSASAGRTVQVLRRGNEVMLYVAAANDERMTYTLHFVHQVSADCSLRAILIDGTPLADYQPSTTDYTVDLPAGSTLPTVSFVKNSETQTLYFGQSAPNTSSVIVVAPSGAEAAYTVVFRIAKYSDASLRDLQVEGYTLAFNPETTDYTLSLANGADLPHLTYTVREGQTVLLADPDADTQQIIVRAESGDTRTYTIRYTRVLSDNALLSDIRIDGVSLTDFEPTRFAYTDTLAWRTRVVPNVFAVGQLPNQTITTAFSAVNGTTRIHVVAADGVTTADYIIAFPVRKSANVALGDLYLNSDVVELVFDPETTDYTVRLPYQASAAPDVVFAKAEPEQTIRFISRPIGQTSQIIVMAENGDQRTYNISFLPTLSSKANRLDTLRVVETGELLNVEASDLMVALPYGTRTLTLDYTKAFAEQTVFVQPGGVYRPTLITVRSNRPDEADFVYTLTPQLSTQNPAVLSSLSVDGTPLPDFDPNRLSYIVDCASSASQPLVEYTAASGVRVQRLNSDAWSWQAEVSQDGYTNTYTLYFHYPNEVIPNADFTDWTKAKYNNGDKPVGWQVPADIQDKITVFWVDAKTGSEIVKTSETVAGLKTTYWSTAGGALPAVMTLGQLAGALAVANSTHYDFAGYINFHNTPDSIAVNYQYKSKAGNGALFAYRFQDYDGTEYQFDYTQTATSGQYTTYTQPLDLNGKRIKGMNIAVDATNESKGASSGAELYVDWFRLAYNSTLSSLTVNGIDAVLSGNDFTATLTDPEAKSIPSLAFVGQVADQAQKVVWQDEVAEDNFAIRRADITNYAEDGTYTSYTLAVRRPFDTRNSLSHILIDGVEMASFNADTTHYTIRLSSHTLPSVCPVPMSSLQTITTRYADSVLTVVVAPEAGDSRTYTIRFVADLSDDTTLASLSGVSDFVPDTRRYTVTADAIPDMALSKQTDEQEVEAWFGADSAVISVKAPSGMVGTYTIVRQSPAAASTGQLAEITLNGNIPSDFAEDKYTYSYVRPDEAAFVRKSEQDSVVFIQTSANMQWQVFGSEQHTYTLTYPTEPSSDTRLAAILLNGTVYADFVPSVYSYTLYSDTLLNISVQKADDKQQVSVSLDAAQNIYTIRVVAEDGTQGTPYTLTLKPTLSSNSLLASILLDGTEISGFNPTTLSYMVTLPTPATKISEPQLPSLEYIVGDASQTVELTAGRLGGNTYITVTSADGHISEYSVLVQAEPSHNADLTGIVVDGEPVAHFEVGRHYYSVRADKANPDITWAADDNFQTVTLLAAATNDLEYTLHVVAQDGVTTQDYTIEVYTESLSSDATLADITLDGLAFADFVPSLNPRLAFSPMQNTYLINLPAGSTALPQVAAILRTDGQDIATSISGMTIYLDVTAPDGYTANRYTLDFVVPLSDNAELAMIYIGGDSLSDFVANRYYYPITLPVGVHTLPEVVAQKAESQQQVSVSRQDNHITIDVLAEDAATTASYTVAFSYTRSDADTLRMIYADESPLADFAPDRFFYLISLPVGTTVFPELSWANADEWQTVRIDTLQHSAAYMVRQLAVTSESGRSRYYTVAYSILQSEVDTLQMIYVDEKPLADFNATDNEYWYTVPASAVQVPSVYPLQGDPYQTISVEQTRETMSDKSLSEKTEIRVVAAAGNTRTYIIHYPMQLSDDHTLGMILVGGTNLSDFDSERFSYKVSLPEATESLPLVTVIKKEEAQQVEITTHGDTVFVRVVAEDKSDATYTLLFERVKSANANLQDIALGDDMSLDFESVHYDYAVTIPYGQTLLPSITPVKAEQEQTVEISEPDILPTGEQVITILVTAPNGIDQCAYTITFSFARNSDNALMAIYVNGNLLENFSSDSTEYVLQYPVGSTTADFAAASQITYTLSDSEAQATLSLADDGTILIAVTAQDGSVRTYIIHQQVLADADNLLSMIYLDHEEFSAFDPEQDFYIYYVVEGLTAPKVTAEARSQWAEVSVKDVSVGDTCIISCTAQSGETRKYYIWFAQSTLNDALTPTADDVLIKRIPGSSQVFVATLRKDVSFALFDVQGHRVALEKLPVADPNDIQMVTEADGRERLLNITDLRSGTLFSLDFNHIYFYVFYFSENQKIASGKLIIVP